MMRRQKMKIDKNKYPNVSTAMAIVMILLVSPILFMIMGAISMYVFNFIAPATFGVAPITFAQGTMGYIIVHILISVGRPKDDEQPSLLWLFSKTAGTMYVLLVAKFLMFVFGIA